MPTVVARSDIVASYEYQVKQLRDLGQEWNLGADQVDKILAASFETLHQRKSGLRWTNLTFRLHLNSSVITLIISLVLLVSSVTVYMFVYYHKPSYNIVARNIQDFIHPIMKRLRYCSLPFVRAYPGVTAVYDESCLVENPVFNYRNIDCWPCINVYSPIDLSEYAENPTSLQPHSVYPFYMKQISPEVTYSNLYTMYWKQPEMFNREAQQISSSVTDWTRIDHLMRHNLDKNPTAKKDAHVTWRINRLEATRAIRQLFKRPKFIPPWVTVERFVLIDEEESSVYDMPMMESFNVFLMQGCGERLIVLEPVYSCYRHCSSIAFHMKPSYLLFYSNLYYTLKSYPVTSSKNISITYIGAY